jgi:folate-binding protein YgfZ
MRGGTVAAPLESSLEAEYRAAHERAVLLDRIDLASLRLEGKDAVDLVHRLSTNAVARLAEGEGTATVFTTSKGRILDLVTAHRVGGALEIVCSAPRVTTLSDWIDRYTFREDVRVADRSGSDAILALCGPEAETCVAAAWPGPSPAMPFGAAAGSLEGHGALLLRTFPLGGSTFLLRVARDAAPAVRALLLAKSAGRLLAAGPECLEILRLEAGLGGADRELTDEHNPWEARLGDAIALDKGCYVGQEVIARLHTYKKVARLLVRLSARSSVPPPPGAVIRVGGVDSGEVTSSALLPDGSGRCLLLGYVRDEDAAAGAAEIVTPEGTLPATLEGVAR